MTDNQHRDRFFVKQRITIMVNRYEIREANPDGSEGGIVAIAQQKRMAFKEQVTFYADEARTQAVFSFKARQAIDLAAVYDVTDGAGQSLGWFQKAFGASLLRSTFNLGGPASRRAARSATTRSRLSAASSIFQCRFTSTSPTSSPVPSSCRVSASSPSATATR